MYKIAWANEISTYLRARACGSGDLEVNLSQCLAVLSVLAHSALCAGPPQEQHPQYPFNFLTQLRQPSNSTTMDYNLRSRKLESFIENAEFRSAYGDMHAHRDAEMMKEHVALMRSARKIDDKMVIELLKPLDKKREWTEEYLETLPNYTGVQPKMAPFETAYKHQRKRDKEMLTFVEDFEAGRIDEDGNPIAQDNADEAVVSGSDTSQLTDVTELEECIEAHPTMSRNTLSLRPRNSSSTPAPELAIASVSSSSSPEPAPKAARPSQTPPPKRKRKRPEKVDLLQPLKGGKTYQGYNYNQLVAVGRERGIYTPGNAQGVRNALIQDDINIAQGLERNVADHKKKVNSYKKFKTEVPDELKTKVQGEPEEDSEEDGEEE